MYNLYRLVDTIILKYKLYICKNTLDIILSYTLIYLGTVWYDCGFENFMPVLVRHETRSMFPAIVYFTVIH